MTTEDFRFPTENVPSFIESPPLWHSSPAASGTDSDNEEETAKEEISTRRGATNKAVNFTERRRLSRIENGQKRDENKEEDEDDDDRYETMDLLWENFEELSRSHSSSRADSDKSSGDGMVEVCCVQSLKLSRTRNMVLKVLRKLFLPHNNSHHHHHHNKLKTRRAWLSSYKLN